MIDYRIEAAHQLVVASASERLDFLEVSNYIGRLMRDPEFRMDYDSLLLIREAAAVPTFADLGLLAPIVKGWTQRRAGVRWAFVLPTPLALGMATIVLEQLAITRVAIRCFTHERAARAWLEKKSLEAAAGRG